MSFTSQTPHLWYLYYIQAITLNQLNLFKAYLDSQTMCAESKLRLDRLRELELLASINNKILTGVLLKQDVIDRGLPLPTLYVVELGNEVNE